MEQCNEKPSTEKPDDSEEHQEQEERGSRWRGALDSARRGIQRSGEVIADATADARDVTVRGIRRSGEAIAEATPGHDRCNQAGNSTLQRGCRRRNY